MASGRLVRGLAMVLAVCVCGLPALTAATPVDPLWIAGVFDGGDHDDAVTASAAPGVPAPALALTVLDSAATRFARAAEARASRVRVLAPGPVRAPPAR